MEEGGAEPANQLGVKLAAAVGSGGVTSATIEIINHSYPHDLFLLFVRINIQRCMRSMIRRTLSQRGGKPSRTIWILVSNKNPTLPYLLSLGVVQIPRTQFFFKHISESAVN